MAEYKTLLVYSQFMGKPYGDHEAEQWARRLKHSSLYVSTENVINAFRVLLLQKFFTTEEVLVFFEHSAGQFVQINFDENARTQDWYEGFCDTNDKALEVLLEWTGSTPWLPEDVQKKVERKEDEHASPCAD